MRKIAIGQAGGPTAVINATLAGFVKEMMNDHSLTFIQNGYDGLTHGEFINGHQAMLDWVMQNNHVPGACLGSGRYPLSEQNITMCIEHLKEIGADALVIIGGNGTMEALRKIEVGAAQAGYDLQVIGLPKTVDNDLGCTDHAPGFASAARYVAQATLDISRDLHSMRNFEQVRILETMGRNAGWLASASGYLRKYEEDGPHFIAIPERPMKRDELLDSIDIAIRRHGCATIVVSEGVRWSEGNQVEREVINGRPVLGGISNEIESFLKKELKIMARFELLGMNQRSSSATVSRIDYKEAYLVGVTGGKWIREGKSGIMVSLQRNGQFGYNLNIIPVGLKEVVQVGERSMPDHFIDDLDTYYQWLRPLIGDDLVSYPSPTPRRDIYAEE
jgi:6-phosphofructokinase 1